MYEVFMDALFDTAKMIPLLLLIYIGIEFLEFKFATKIGKKVKHAGKLGPLLGAMFGCIPQCGFSVISTTFYARRLITVGTLLAVYLSTSDEAIPVILSRPNRMGLILPLLLTKVIIAIIAGYVIDHVLNRKYRYWAEDEFCAVSQDAIFEGEDANSFEMDETGCCGHHPISEKLKIKELVLHPIIHTIKVFFFIFAVSALLNLIMHQIGDGNLGRIFLGKSIFQPVIAAFIGLIPNCAASVVITELYIKGAISFGSAIAGLSASAGLGMIVLFKENGERKDTLRIIGLLLIVSIVAGMVLHFIL